MENILKAAYEAVVSAKSMISYYEKEIEQKKEYLQKAIEKADNLEKEYQQLLEKLNLTPQNNFPF